MVKPQDSISPPKGNGYPPKKVLWGIGRVSLVSLAIAHANLLKSEQESGIMEESGFSVEAMVRGYHIYRDIWMAEVNEEVSCQREPF